MASSIPIASLLLKITADAKQANTEIDGFTRQIGKSFGESTRQTLEQTKAFIAVGAVATTVAASMIAMAMSTAQVGAQLYKASQTTGMSVEELSALRVAVGGNEDQFNALVKGITKLDKTMDAAITSNGAARDSFKKVGVSVQDLKALSPDQLFEKIAVSIAHYTDSGQKAALMQALFGKAGAQLIPVFDKLGKEGFEAARQKARDLGQEFTFLEAMESIKLVRATKDLELGFTGIKNEIGKAVIPILLDLVTGLKPILVAIVSFVRDHPDVTRGIFLIAGGIAFLTGAIITMTIATAALNLVTGGLLLVLGLIATLLAGAVVLFVAAGRSSRDLNKELGGAEEAGKKGAKGIDKAAQAAKQANEDMWQLGLTVKLVARLLLDVFEAFADLNISATKQMLDPLNLLHKGPNIKEAIAGFRTKIFSDIVDVGLEAAKGPPATTDTTNLTGDGGKEAKAAKAKQRRSEELKDREDQAKKELSIEQFELDQEQAIDDEAYDNKIISLQRYWDSKAGLIMARAQAEIDEQRKIIAAEQALIDNPAATEEERGQARNKIKEAETKIQEVLNKQVLDLGKNTHEATKATKELTESYKELRDQIAELNMSPFQKAQAETADKFEKLRKQLKDDAIAAGEQTDEAAMKELDRAQLQEETLNRFHELERQIAEDRAVADNQKQQAQDAYDNGLINQVQLEQRILAIEIDLKGHLKDKVAEEQLLLPVLDSTGYKLNDVNTAVNKNTESWKQLGVASNDAMKKLNDTVQSGLVTAFTQIFSLQKGILASFKDFGRLILNTIAEIAATKLVKWLLGDRVGGQPGGGATSGGAGATGGLLGGILGAIGTFFTGESSSRGGASGGAPLSLPTSGSIPGTLLGTNSTVSAAGLGGGSLAGLKGGIAGMLPLLGLSLGGQLGGPSKAGSIIGSVGGGLAGLSAAAFLAPGIFGTGAFGAAIVPLLTNPITIGIGAALLVGALLLGKSSQRHKDEDQAHQALAQALSAIQTIQTNLDAGQISGTDAISQAQQVRQQFVDFSGTLKTASVRKAMMDPNQYIGAIDKAISGLKTDASKRDADKTKSDQDQQILAVDTNILGSISPSILHYLGSFGKGSFSLPSDGFAYVHKGESIIPADVNPFKNGKAAMLGGIHVDIHDNKISDEVDMDDLANRVGEAIDKQVRFMMNPVKSWR